LIVGKFKKPCTSSKNMYEHMEALVETEEEERWRKYVHFQCTQLAKLH
jgi:hypothetical protein